MGLLVQGTPLDWEEALPWLSEVRHHGILQFLATFHRVKDIKGDELKFGDELEYGIFTIDEQDKSVRLALRGAEILSQLNEKEKKYGRNDSRGEACHWVPEYGSWMIEATPKIPYGGFLSDLSRVETNMRLRRARLLTVLQPNEIAPTVTCFPLLGVGDHVFPAASPNGPIAESLYVSDAVINPHPRFGTLTKNIRKRRSRKVDIRVPIFQDVYTGQRQANEIAWVAESSRPKYISNGSPSNSISKKVLEIDGDKTKGQREKKEHHLSEPYPGFIHMDCMAFGMGMCCLQVTFQAKNIGESRHLYDHLGVLSPILLALTAATPILKGRLADTDVRWATISAAVDDRTRQEMGLEPPPTDPEEVAKYNLMAGNGKKLLPKSRYEGISAYICNHNSGKDRNTSLDTYNDVEVPYDEASYETLIANGVDIPLAKHISHLFIRDPLVIYSERIHLNDECETDHFENIQSTNWQTVRWKPPPPPANCPKKKEQNEQLEEKESEKKPEEHVGWRTEFRSMEVQLTDFENAAFTVFIVLVSRVILLFNLNLYIPLSKVNANMEKAHRVNACVEEYFYFRSHMAPPEEGDCCNSNERSTPQCSVHSDPNCYEPMSIAEIMFGKGDHFPGLIPLIYAYLDHIECDEGTREVITRYLTLIGKRATGELPTAATWMRRFVKFHPDYAHDSVVTSTIAYDLLMECKKVGEGLQNYPDLLGDVKISPIKCDTPYEVPLISHASQLSKRTTLLKRYIERSCCSAEDQCC